MDILLLFKALVLGVVEGLTEFLPISSTGHLILTGALLDFNDARGKLFEVVIQSGAIFAICWEYRHRIIKTVRGIPADPVAQNFALNLLIAFLPALVLGFFFGSLIKAYLFSATIVAVMFIVGGLVILWAERRQHTAHIQSVDQIGRMDALKVGFAQTLALIPGTSRSGATIIGGLIFGFSRRTATEFSFFLAIPTLLAATVYQLYKERELIQITDWGMWVVGFVSAFISAFICVRWLLRYISSHDFSVFAWYRISFGILVLLTDYYALIAWSK